MKEGTANYIAGVTVFAGSLFIGKIGATSEISEISETTRLQSLVSKAANEVDALGDAAFTPKQFRAIERNPNLRAMYRGNRIAVRARVYMKNDPLLSHLKSNYTRGADFVDPFTGRWWNMTTSAQWQRHVIRYGKGGTLLQTN